MIDAIVKLPATERAARCVKHCELALNAGFTSVREVGGMGASLKPLIEEGQVPGPNIYYAGDILSTTGGHGDIHSWPLTCIHALTLGGNASLGLSCLCDGVPECLKAVRKQLRTNASHIKICASGGVMSEVDDCMHQ